MAVLVAGLRGMTLIVVMFPTDVEAFAGRIEGAMRGIGLGPAEFSPICWAVGFL